MGRLTRTLAVAGVVAASAFGGVALAAAPAAKTHVAPMKHPMGAMTPHHCPNMANTSGTDYSGLDM